MASDPKSVRDFFDEMMALGVEGMMLSPGYSYDKAPDQQHFLGPGPHAPAVQRDSFQPEGRHGNSTCRRCFWNF